MNTQDNTRLLARATELQNYVAEGRLVEALEEFYDEQSAMSENTEPPIVGRAANIAREREFIASVAEWRKFEVLRIAAVGDTTFVETESAYTLTDGTQLELTQVSRQVWRNDRIVDERFYHGA